MFYLVNVQVTWSGFMLFTFKHGYSNIKTSVDYASYSNNVCRHFLGGKEDHGSEYIQAIS